MTRAPRAVLDTNVVLSALIFSKGHLAPIRIGWQQGVFHPLVSKAATEELIRAMNYPKFKLSNADRNELLADYLPYCTIVRLPAKGPKTPPVRDALDVPFLQLALHGKARYLATGDKDLLSVRGHLPFAIVSAADFIVALGLQS
ncbi:MAG: putative toxin-antitoxin system toxin component, PIN family [Steroidobacteraceae bacterium]